MSYILDALKRAERERKQGQVSVLDEIPTAPVTGEPRRRLPSWLPILVAVVVLALLIYALLAWRHHGAKDAGIASAPTPLPPPVQAVAAPPPAPALPPDAVQRGTPPPPAPAATIEDGGKIATLDDVYGGPPPPDRQGNQAPAQQMRPPGPPPGGDRGQMRRGPPPAAVPPQDATAGDNAVAANEMAPPPGNDAAPPDAAAAANTAPDTGAGAPPPPASAQDQIQQAPPEQRQLREMPENFRANFPAFTVDVHAYNSNPQRRFVLIGGKRYHEGDTMAEGPRIIGIVPEGLVLDWQGQQVLYAISH